MFSGVQATFERLLNKAFVISVGSHRRTLCLIDANDRNGIGLLDQFFQAGEIGDENGTCFRCRKRQEAKGRNVVEGGQGNRLREAGADYKPLFEEEK